MDSFIDRLADFIKSLRGNDGSSSNSRPSSSGGARYRDPDVQEAWEELDEYMRTGSNTAKESRGSQGSTRASGSSARARPAGPDESLRQDYSNLEVAFGADIETVRASYKRLVLKYHPDRQGDDPDRQRISLEIMKKINQSFERIRDFHEKSSR